MVEPKTTSAREQDFIPQKKNQSEENIAIREIVRCLDRGWGEGDSKEINRILGENVMTDNPQITRKTAEELTDEIFAILKEHRPHYEPHSPSTYFEILNLIALELTDD